MRFSSTFFARLASIPAVRRLIRLYDTRLMRILFLFPLASCLITVTVLLLFYRTLPPQVPVYYSRPWGNDQLTSPAFLFILPVGSLIWYLITLLLISWNMFRYRVFAQVLLLGSGITSALSLLVVVNILRLIL